LSAGHPRDPALDIVTRRQHLDRFLIEIGQPPLAEADRLALIAHCASCKDERQVIAFLTLMREVGLADPADIHLLFFLVRPGADAVFCDDLRTRTRPDTSICSSRLLIKNTRPTSCWSQCSLSCPRCR
jgi:hypothetical protein